MRKQRGKRLSVFNFDLIGSALFGSPIIAATKGNRGMGRFKVKRKNIELY